MKKVLLLITLGLLCTALRAGSLPSSLKLHYTVTVGKAELGSLLTELTRDGDDYHVQSETRAEGMASILLGGAIRENCRFTVTSELLRPSSYRVVREGRRAYQHSAIFDWSSKQISFSEGDTIAMPADGYVVDNCSVPFAFMLAGSQLLDQSQLHVVGGNRIRHYENLRMSQENIDTPLGSMDTIRIQQQRVGKPERKLTIWVAPGKNNLPVKIVEKRKSRTTTMVLRSVRGI